MSVEQEHARCKQPTTPIGISTKRGDQPAILLAPKWLQDVALAVTFLTLAIVLGVVFYAFGSRIYKDMTKMPSQCAMATSPVERGSQA